MSEPNDHRATALTFLHHCLMQLESALQDRNRPDARFVTLSTVAGPDRPGELVRAEARTVVVRGWNNVPPEWRFHTDRRAAKVSERSLAHSVSAVFWESTRQLQLRLQGIASECSDTAAITKAWDDLGVRGQQSYWRVEPPGTELRHPEALSFSRSSSDELSGSKRALSPHFMLVTVAVTKVDCLCLADDPHHRAQGEWTHNEWQARWVAP